EGSQNESPNNPSNRSHRSHKSERSKRPRKERRYEEEEPMRERRYKEEPQRMRRYKEGPRKASLAIFKCKILPFVRDEDVESYLEWEMKADQVRMVTYEFSEYALTWWDQYIREVRKGRRRHIDTWLDLRKEIKTRFVLVSYTRNLYNRLHRMYHGSKSIEEYYKDIEVTLMRANVLESNEGTITCFLHGMSREICDACIRQLDVSLKKGGAWPQRKKEWSIKDNSLKKGSSPS
ncbi:hypothetical protein CR513_47643, partial [Mucuna pruriens]